MLQHHKSANAMDNLSSFLFLSLSLSHARTHIYMCMWECVYSGIHSSNMCVQEQEKEHITSILKMVQLLYKLNQQTSSASSHLETITN